MSTEAKAALSPSEAGIIENRNPLRVIGWGINMVSLRLSTDEYHHFALHQARKLAAVKHSDRGYSTEVSQHFVLAYEAIKDREKFEQALGELKQDRNQRLRDESEMLELTRLMNVGLRKKLAESEKRLERDGLTLDKLQLVKNNLERFVAERAVEIMNTDSRGDIVSCNLHSVKSLDLMTIRFTGSVKPKQSSYPWEKVLKVDEVDNPSIHKVLKHFGVLTSSESYLLTRATSFIKRAPASHFVILGVKRFNVRNGRIARVVKIPKGLKIVGSVSEHNLDEDALNISQLVYTQMESIASHISPIIIRDRLLVVDRSPLSYSTKPAVSRTQPLNSRKLLDRKIGTYTKRRLAVNSSTDLVLLGLIAGINQTKQLKQSQK